MWPPSVSPVEMVILLAIALPTFLLAGRYSRWLLGIIACFALAVVATPSDPGSTLVAGGLLSLLYCVAVVIGFWLIREREE